jgi:hypothetical protein
MASTSRPYRERTGTACTILPCSGLFATKRECSHHPHARADDVARVIGAIGKVIGDLLPGRVRNIGHEQGAKGLESYASVIGPAKIVDTGSQVQPTERNCDVDGGLRWPFDRYNLATAASCGLNAPSDIVGEGDPMLGPLGDNGGFGETLSPEPGSLVIDRMPTEPIDRCDLAPFEGFLEEGDQHLEGLIADRRALMLQDQRGVDRPQGQACDIGAVELGP